jgi:hypothetical protein
MASWRNYMKKLNLSEVKAAKKAKISRLTWRAVMENKPTVELQSLFAVAGTLGLDVTILTVSGEQNSKFSSDCSTVAAGFNVLRDGKASWKIHYMNLVDEFRRTVDSRLLLLPPPTELSIELTALLAGIVTSLCWEFGIDTPAWADRRYDLPEPWFVSETESLKAISILESPLPFRRNNIFVGFNFLQRA